ncbi:MAG: F0F1 ATP synthase subunit A [Terriglobales bacterium]
MEQLPLTALLNKYFGGLALALLHALHIRPAYPKAPITNFVAMEILVTVLLLLFFVLVRTKLSVESPGGLQHVVEGLHGFIQNQSEEIIGHHSERYTPFLVTLFSFILLCNLLGVVPGFESPTANPAVPLGCAIIAFLYYNLQGFKAKGVHYAADFLGPVWWLAWLMLPIELISHFARMLSLTIRLFANMFAGDMVTLVFFSLVPLGVPVAFLGLHIGVSLLQAYIFVLLTTVYLSGAVSAAH